MPNKSANLEIIICRPVRGGHGHKVEFKDGGQTLALALTAFRKAYGKECYIEARQRCACESCNAELAGLAKKPPSNQKKPRQSTKDNLDQPEGSAKAAKKSRNDLAQVLEEMSKLTQQLQKMALRYASLLAIENPSLNHL